MAEQAADSLNRDRVSEEHIPRELKGREQWIVWRSEKRGDKWDKVPKAPWKYGGKLEYNASPTDPENWTCFKTALECAGNRGETGVGYCFSKEDPFVGIDLDDCVDGDGNIEKWASEIIEKADSYTELSPSGTGVHIIVKGELPRSIKYEDGKKKIEVYTEDRYFTVTGRALQERKPLAEGGELLQELRVKYGKEETDQIDYREGRAKVPLSVMEVIEKFAPNNDLEKHGEGLQGSHPYHGSDSGFNFKVVPEENKWCCYRDTHECGGGPFELLAIFEEIIECGSWGWGERSPLRRKKWINTVDAAAEEGLISPDEQEELKKKPVEAELIPSRIRAEHVHKRVKVRGRVRAEKGQKALPSKVEVRCRECGKSKTVETKDPSLKRKLIFKGGSRTTKILREYFRRLLPAPCDPDDERKNHNITIRPKEHLDYSIVWLDDLLENMDVFHGNRRTQVKVAVLGCELPNSRKIEVEGEVEVDPRSDDIVILADKADPVDTLPEKLELSEEMLHHFTNSFGATTPVSLSHQIAPDMVGRDPVRLSRLLTLHSPRVIPDIDGKRKIRGCLRECLFGDTKTYKSESVKDVTKEHYQFGDYTTAETGSRAGLIYSVDTDRDTLRWGALPLNDKGYVGIDGLNKLHSNEMQEFREVLEDQRVVVRKYVSGEAQARVRITGCMNPPHPMDQYTTPCEAIIDTYIFEKTPDITRWDIFIPFNDDDVPKEDIVNMEEKERPIDDDLFKYHVYWAWSREPEQIRYGEDAVERIKKEAKELIEKYTVPSLPIVHNGIRDVLTRLSVSFACLLHSTPDHENVIVKEDHVKKAVGFYRDMLDKLELEKYKEIIEEKIELDKKDYLQIITDVDKTHVGILLKLVRGPTPSSELAEKLNVSVRTVKGKYELLKEHELIETKTGKGAGLTKKGVKLVRRLFGLEEKKKGEVNPETISEIVKEPFTNDLSQEEIIHKIFKFYEEYGDPDWTVSEFLDPLTEHFKNMSREGLKKYVLKLKEGGKITLQETLEGSRP